MGEERKESEKYNEWVSISPARTDSDSSGYIYISASELGTIQTALSCCVSPRVVCAH